MTPFEEFQKEEYGKIAEAHFKTIDSISAFFRYYLILMALPLSLIGAFVALGARPSVSADVLEALFKSAKPTIGIVFAVIGLVGLPLMLYVANLRFDALLYARTVNALRKFFYDRAEEGFLQRARMRVLPQNAFEPQYFEGWFLPVVFVFAGLNTLYVTLGSILIIDPSSALLPGDGILSPPWWTAAMATVFFVSHSLFYWLNAHVRETRYLRRGSIGLDIDGVLNRHREHFAATLERIGGPSIDPNSIVTLPVRHSLALGVTREDERAVFNRPEYWLDMPPERDVAYFVRTLRELGLDVHVVSNRPWPDLRELARQDAKDLNNAWLSAGQRILFPGCEIWRVWLTWVYIFLQSKPVIELVTRAWLKKYQIPFDSLTIERSLSKDGMHYSRATTSRVQIAHKHSLKFFVEDDWEAAFRLAFVCDVVFLIRHPYNQAVTRDLFGKKQFTEELPGNVVVVDGWPDIHRAIRQLM